MAEVGRRLLWFPGPWGKVVRVPPTRGYHRGVAWLKKVSQGHWGVILCNDYPPVALEVEHFGKENFLLGLESEFQEQQLGVVEQKKEHVSSRRDVESLEQVTGVLGEWSVEQQESGVCKHQGGALSHTSVIPEESLLRHWGEQEEVTSGYEVDVVRVLSGSWDATRLHFHTSASYDHWILCSPSRPCHSTARINSVTRNSTKAPRGFLATAFRDHSIAPCMRPRAPASTRGVFSAPGHRNPNPFTRVYSTSNGAGRNNGSLNPPLFRSPTAYYDILGITGSATQSQIKTAYYRQSFRNHPDRNSGDEEAALRFNDISEAYFILGSVALRKKYDRGTLNQEDVRTAGKPPGKVGSTTPKRTESTSSSRYSPTNPVFDFDEFYRAHYGEQLERERYMKWRREELQRRRRSLGEQWQMKKVSEVAVLVLICSAAFIFFSLK